MTCNFDNNEMLHTMLTYNGYVVSIKKMVLNNSICNCLYQSNRWERRLAESFVYSFCARPPSGLECGEARSKMNSRAHNGSAQLSGRTALIAIKESTDITRPFARHKRTVKDPDNQSKRVWHIVGTAVIVSADLAGSGLLGSSRSFSLSRASAFNNIVSSDIASIQRNKRTKKHA